MHTLKRFFEILKGSITIFKAIQREKHQQGDVHSKSTIRDVFTDLGPTFIKLGQMLSLRPDIVPLGIADELRKLLDHGEPIAPDVVDRVFHEEFGKTPADIFDSFETAPFAVASLAQVHRATYKKKL